MILLDVILPLAIQDAYTYRVPEGMPCPLVGERVLVPLARKQITGIVAAVRHNALPPDGITLRYVIEVIDDAPIVLPTQIDLWRWIVNYYMCSLGEVMTAALPAGIIDNDYTARTEVYVTLAPKYADIESLQPVLSALYRAPVQRRLLETFLDLSGALDNALQPVPKRTLIEQAGGAPAILRALVERGVLIEQKEEVSRLPAYDVEPEPIHPLDEQQTNALTQIRQAWDDNKVCLLHGVTASGKTEVYMHLIQQTLSEGKSVLYLVPEIALTTQLTERLKRVFGKQIQVYHSRFSDKERVEIYHDLLHAQQPRLVLSARSGVFLPFTRLGLVIVDEEHDTSYKQQDPAPRYHARSVAIVLAQMQHAQVLLGTATPSIETYYNAQRGKYRLVHMPQRYAGILLPDISLVDLQQQYHRKEMYGHFSDPLVDKIRENLAAHKQVIIFQNRRGYAPYLSCRQCGFVPKCANCDVSMTYHKLSHTLVCHYCGYTITMPSSCPQCGGQMHDHGLGTEKVEDEVATLFPEARVARMDLDSTRNKNAHQRLINAFAAHDIDILIGTQMVTKGLHFSNVSLVAVLNADAIMATPDFRSYEYAFQMLEQVAGRAGRTGKQGEVIIQTFKPQTPVFNYLIRHDYQGFYREQMVERKMFRFPPFYRLIELTLKHRDLSRLQTASRLLAENLKHAFGGRCSDVIIPVVARVQNMHVRSIRLRIEADASVATAKTLIKQHISYVLQQPGCKGTIIQPDVDPM